MTEQQHTELVREFTAKSPKHPYPALDVDAMFAEIVRLRARTATLTEATQAFTARIADVLACPTWDMTRGSIESARCLLGDTLYYGEYVLADDVLNALGVPQ
jgi:hypothetical protein